MSFTFDIVGIEGMTERLSKATDVVLKEVDGEIEASMKQMVRDAIREAPRDIGRLANAITYDRIADFSFKMVCQVFYAAYMEFGTKGRYQAIPGVDASKFQGSSGANGRDFFDAILEWVKRKGFASLKTPKGNRSNSLESTIAQEQVAFQIYLSILRHGVHPHPFFFKQLTAEQPLLIQRLKTILGA